MNTTKQKAKAVIARAHGAPIVVKDIWVDAPRQGEVMIKVEACGVCHSELSAAKGVIPLPPPVVLGHEGAGRIVAVGDRVVSSFVSMCGHCRYCTTGRPQFCDQNARTTHTHTHTHARRQRAHARHEQPAAARVLWQRHHCRIRHPASRQRGQDRTRAAHGMLRLHQLWRDDRLWRCGQYRQALGRLACFGV